MAQVSRCVAAHRVDGVAFSPDGESVAIKSMSFGDTLQLFDIDIDIDIDSGTARWKRSGHGAALGEVAFNADGSLLSIADSTTTTILAAGDGHVVMRRRVPWASDSPVQAFISPDGTWLSTVYGSKVRVYDVRSGAETLAFRLPGYTRVRYSPDGTRIATLGKDGIHVWDAAFGQLQARLQSVPRKTNEIQFGGCSHVLVTAARNDSVIRVWDVASGTLTGLCDTAPSPKWLTLGDGRGRVALTQCRDRTFRVWDLTTGQERTRLPAPQRLGIGAVNGDATKLATSNGGRSVKIWSIAVPIAAAPADAPPPDDWCPRCSARWPTGHRGRASGPSQSPKRR